MSHQCPIRMSHSAYFLCLYRCGWNFSGEQATRSHLSIREGVEGHWAVSPPAGDSLSGLQRGCCHDPL